jgi:prophage regulatory protein
MLVFSSSSKPLKGKIMAILRLKQVASLLSISKSSIYERLNPRSRRYDPTFPKRISLSNASGGAVGFLQEDVNAWIASRVGASRPEQTAKNA